LRFRPLQRFPRPGQRHELAQACLPEPPAPPGSRNLLAPSSAPSLPALFHAGSAPGVTLQSFPPPAQPYAVSSVSPLLGFEPPSGFSSARESTTRISCLDQNRARSSPGSFPLQGSLSSRAGSVFHLSSPPVVDPLDASGLRASTSGFLTREAWLVSLETADPHGVCDLVVHHVRSSLARILESPQKTRARRHRLRLPFFAF